MAGVVQLKIQIGRTIVRLIKDDVTDLDVDALVFYAQPDLQLGSGFGNAIAVRGGPTIQEELETLGPIATGEAVVSDGGNLKAKFIIHSVGPRFQEEETESKLRTTVRNTLAQADAKGVERIAFPAMGAGYYGIPTDLCARVMLETIKEYLEGETAIKELILCVLDTPQYESFRARLTSLF